MIIHDESRGAIKPIAVAFIGTLINFWSVLASIQTVIEFGLFQPKLVGIRF